MSNVSNNNIKQSKQRFITVWLIAFLSIFSFAALTTIGLSAYQQNSRIPKPAIQNAQLEILKQQILQQTDAIDTNWLHTLNPLVKDVRGRLLWSSTKQQGLMEFSGLPSLSDTQSFLLEIYDLSSKSTKPIRAVFNKKESSEHLLIPFTSSEIVKNPFKFELILKDKEKKANQHLLLAQP